MPPYSVSDRALSQLAGFDVLEQVDAPASFVWIRRANGHEVDRSNEAFGDPDSAWADAIDVVVETVVADASLSYSEWDTLGPDRQESLVRESFPCSANFTPPLAEHLA